MKKKFVVGMSYIFAVAIASLIVYYILLYPNRMHISIEDIMSYLDDLKITQHLLALGLLSIYIGVIIFGAALFGMLISTNLHRVLFRSK